MSNGFNNFHINSRNDQEMDDATRRYLQSLALLDPLAASTMSSFASLTAGMGMMLPGHQVTRIDRQSNLSNTVYPLDESLAGKILGNGLANNGLGLRAHDTATTLAVPQGLLSGMGPASISRLDQVDGIIKPEAKKPSKAQEQREGYDSHGDASEDDEEEEEDDLADDEFFRRNQRPPRYHDMQNNVKRPRENFPLKLYRMLYEAEQNGQADIISFFPNGRAFAIHKPKEFISEIMPKYFTNGRINTFLKQLNLYSFRRITEGQDKGGYFNAKFTKGKRNMCKKIKRKRTNNTVVNSAKSVESNLNKICIQGKSTGSPDASIKSVLSACSGGSDKKEGPSMRWPSMA